jgi:hypothetical protein
MHAYTVLKPRAMREQEYQAYTGLLEGIGIDINDVPRTPEPSTKNRWLYVWSDRNRADRFARELRRRTDDRSWTIHEVDSPVEEHGPLAPLVIMAIESPEGTTFRVVAESQERVMRRFPNARLAGERFFSTARPADEVFFSTETRFDYERQHGPVWDQVAILLLGIPHDLIARLGGFRVVTPEGEILHEDFLDRPA